MAKHSTTNLATGEREISSWSKLKETFRGHRDTNTDNRKNKRARSKSEPGSQSGSRLRSKSRNVSKDTNLSTPADSKRAVSFQAIPVSPDLSIDSIDPDETVGNSVVVNDFETIPTQAQEEEQQPSTQGETQTQSVTPRAMGRATTILQASNPVSHLHKLASISVALFTSKDEGDEDDGLYQTSTFAKNRYLDLSTESSSDNEPVLAVPSAIEKRSIRIEHGKLS